VGAAAIFGVLASGVGLDANKVISVAVRLGTDWAVSVGVTAPAWAVRVTATAVKMSAADGSVDFTAPLQALARNNNNTNVQIEPVLFIITFIVLVVCILRIPVRCSDIIQNSVNSYLGKRIHPYRRLNLG
jgi:hypothetical protein